MLLQHTPSAAAALPGLVGLAALCALSTGCLAGIGSHMADDRGRSRYSSGYRLQGSPGPVEVPGHFRRNGGLGMTFGATLFGGVGGAAGHRGGSVGAFAHLDMSYVWQRLGISLSGGYGMDGGGDDVAHSSVRGVFVRPLVSYQLGAGLAGRLGVGFLLGERTYDDGTFYCVDNTAVRPEVGLDIPLRRSTFGWDFYLRPAVALTLSPAVMAGRIELPAHQTLSVGGSIVISD
jgi:hypothetical protein